jgi:SAM-dependent methyltransferase
MSNKASKEYWEQTYATAVPRIAHKQDTVRRWIEQHFLPLPKNDKKSCIEIGCYPGQYLSVFGELGYELYGVDFCTKVELMAASLRNAGYTVGQIWKDDFLRFGPHRKFDVVASFGFIEHFDNFIEVIERHISLMNDQGYLIIEAPNFIGGFQRWFHFNFDKLNYERHHIPAMEIRKWTELLAKRNLRIIFEGYFGPLEFWTDDERRSRKVELFLKVAKEYIGPVLRMALPRDRKFYSPYVGVIAQKNKACCTVSLEESR